MNFKSNPCFCSVIDSNKDGVISLNEGARYLNKTEEVRGLRNGDFPQWFQEMDENNDGLIQPLELDKDYYYGTEQEHEESSDLAVGVNVHVGN